MVSGEKETIVRDLIDKGVDINARTKHMAAEVNHPPLARMLTDHGADVIIPNFGKTALIKAAEYYDIAMVLDLKLTKALMSISEIPMDVLHYDVVKNTAVEKAWRSKVNF